MSTSSRCAPRPKRPNLESSRSRSSRKRNRQRDDLRGRVVRARRDLCAYLQSERGVRGMWYPYPPYYMYPPHYVYRRCCVHSRYIRGAAIWGNCNWHGGNVNVHVSHYNSFNRTNINNRTGITTSITARCAVQGQGVAQQYNRGRMTRPRSRARISAASRDRRAEMKDMDRSELQDAPQADRANRRSRPGRAGDRDRASQRGSGRRTGRQRAGELGRIFRCRSGASTRAAVRAGVLVVWWRRRSRRWWPPLIRLFFQRR